MRRSAAQAFYLAVFALFSGGCTVQAASPASTHTSPDVCALEPEAKVSDACASYADLDSLNNRLYPYIRNLANNTDFFSYYRLNLYDKECPFWSDENGLCGNIACAVTTLENETQIPQIWRAEKLSALEGPKAQHPGRKQQRERQRPLLDQLGTGVGESCVVEYDDECDDRDYCVPEDETASGKGDYVSLAENPERFTGYAGEGAHQVWEAIYRENCFSRPSTPEDSVNVPGLSAPFQALSENQAHAAMDFKQVMKAAIKSGVAEQALDAEEECLEKRVFYRVISGMHASISTHLCHDYLNQTTGQWGPNLQCYKERLHEHPERLSNLYFNYALVLRAVGKLRDYVQDYTFCTGDPEQDQLTKDMIKKLAGAIPAGPQIFDESVMFTDLTADGISLKEDFRNRFRNVSRIMDCVGCDKCRLWGKIQTNGFGTALKVLFEFGNGHVGDQKPLLRRTELVALINTLDKISAAMKALETFRGMIVAEKDGTEPVEQAKLPQASPAEMAASLDDFDDFADGEADQGVGNDEQSITDVFREEFGLIFRAWVYVLKSWIGAPKKLGSIALMELSRLWDYWLGKPMRPRSWEFKGPNFREL
ncbi:endoplasmic oxidoreductin-1 [Friedmanniomyces endolithicus]|uniref:Endoplasmic oxidoreductin-1 n=1 Tax=Friedmanniomyces endolithicus TaxID=329885 RepID=A0AAN6KAT7_9PEZI|nr:endoplasmic oxidoreductin-1 [Friedmanniomyces endolithicus]KAK0285335.1 endoplasmic oxidoreductin-1 [Friedmanniomyces endolithicus]KAK0309453.1 endoplasmic oxidoreductin-1 [Friedmanniomyces endolithicus]KAK0321027.1 endoplasmic oxidoreductin-1 [Friedmanniomyces endolithicus]KAK0833204.1 endoplasmic oxidoreductin-1 [Friedmanniomyces endolithicus]